VLLEDLYTKVFRVRNVNLVEVVEKSFSYYVLYKLKKWMSSFLYLTACITDYTFSSYNNSL
jgi:hypothetical protein